MHNLRNRRESAAKHDRRAQSHPRKRREPRVFDTVEILWEDRNENFRGHLTCRDKNDRYRFLIRYDDGDVMWDNLDFHYWRYANHNTGETDAQNLWFEPGELTSMQTSGTVATARRIHERVTRRRRRARRIPSGAGSEPEKRNRHLSVNQLSEQKPARNPDSPLSLPGPLHIDHELETHLQSKDAPSAEDSPRTRLAPGSVRIDGEDFAVKMIGTRNEDNSWNMKRLATRNMVTPGLASSPGHLRKQIPFRENFDISGNGLPACTQRALPPKKRLSSSTL